MNSVEIWTVELNMDTDFAENCSWHVDRLDFTCNRNIKNALRERNIGNWALVAITKSLKDANQKSKEIQEEMCRKAGKIPVGLPFLI